MLEKLKLFCEVRQNFKNSKNHWSKNLNSQRPLERKFEFQKTVIFLNLKK